jgi:HEPN domain-containing protein
MNEVAQALIELASKFAHQLQVAWGENLVSVVLYGSVARSQCHKDSDADLLVVAVEQSLKAALRFVGIEPPKWHDVGEILRRNKNQFPDWFAQEVEVLSRISGELREDREFSFYGDEEAGKTPEELFSEADACQAFEGAKRVHELCRRVISPGAAH